MLTMTIFKRAPRGAPSARRMSPLPSGRRVARIGRLWLAILLVLGSPSPAQERSPFPSFEANRHLYKGEGVPGDYQAIEKQIAALEKARPGYHYDVVVVRSAGPHSRTATRDYADDLSTAWRQHATASGRPPDEAHSLLIVVAIDNQQVAVHPGSTLSALGLRGDRIHQEVVKPSGFLDLAPDRRYPEAIAALLNRADQWIGEHTATGEHTAAPEKSTVPPSPPIQAPRTTQATPGVAVPPATRSDHTTGLGLATGLGLSLAVILTAVLGGLWFVHHRTRGRLDRRIKEIRSRATDIMDRLDALKERLKLLPATDPDFRRPMAGETAALYAQIQDAVGKLWDRWLQVMDSVERAQKLALGITSPFKWKALHDAEAVLDQKGVFEEIDVGARACTAEMDRLNQAHESARGELDALARARPQVDAQVETIRNVGLPVEPYQEELAAIAAEADQARELIPADPIGARSILEGLRARGEALVARAGRVAAMVQESQKVAAALEGLKRQAAEHRAKGLRLDEEGGNPDAALADADRAHAAAITSLNAGDPDAAEKDLATARSSVEQARSTIEQVRNARDYCRREQPERLRTTDRLRSALPHAEESYHRLEREFAPASWQDVRPSLDQVRELLGSFEQATAEAAAQSTDEVQRYLAGAARLRQVAQQQQAALRLMSGIGDRLNALSAVRDECRRRRGDLDAATRRVEGAFRENDPMVGTMALQILDEARRGRDAVLNAFDRPQPDWPSIREGLDRALESFKVAQDQAEVDVRSYRQLAGEYERARAELERVASLLAGRQEDRVAANQRFRSAAEALDQVGGDLGQPHGEWPRMLEHVREAVADLQQADRLAREDIRLAAQAQSEIDEAVRSIDQARGYSAMDVGTDTSAAEAAIARAEQLLGAQQYEQAIQCAAQAQQAARRAHQDAVQQASWRQMQADAERRRWEGSRGGSALEDALTTGAAVAAGVILGNVIHGAAEASPHSMPEPAISPPPPPTDTSVSTWESDTGQSSW